MKKILAILMIIFIAITSAHAGAGGDAWRSTKKAGSEAWDGTKETSKKVWKKTEKTSQSTWENIKDFFK